MKGAVGGGGVEVQEVRARRRLGRGVESARRQRGEVRGRGPRRGEQARCWWGLSGRKLSCK
eukprot:2227351-Pleurochrysis_carterae.AAC.1